MPRAFANIKLLPVLIRALDSIESIRLALLFVIVIDVPESSTQLSTLLSASRAASVSSSNIMSSLSYTINSHLYGSLGRGDVSC